MPIFQGAALAFLALFFLLPTSGSFADQTTFRVAVLYWSMNIPGQVAMRQGLEHEAMEINRRAEQDQKPKVHLLPAVAGDGAQGIERQIAQMTEAIEKNVDILIIQPTDNAALATPLKMANRAGVPVITYDQYISGGELAAYITSDNHQAGYVDGEYVAAQFPDWRTLRLVLVDYPHVSSTVERINGFLDALHDYNQPYTILKTYEAVEPEGGKRTARELLRDFPERGSIDVVFTVNDGGGLSMVDVLAEQGRDEIFIATVDGDPLSVENIREGRMTRIDAAQFCGVLGSEAMKTAYSLLLGNTVARHILIPVFPITRETVTLYPGWQGPLPQPFQKPWRAKNKLWQGAILYK